MNTNLPHSSLLREIERYFDCSLTEAEEEALRERLASDPGNLPEVREAMAVMGLRCRHVTERRAARIWRPAAAIAAAACVLLLLVTVTPRYSLSAEASSYAYVNGKYVTDHDEITSELRRSLEMFDLSSDDNMAELLPLVSAIEINESTTDISL